MRTDDDALAGEFDFGGAIRGRFAYLFGPEQREAFLRSAPFDDHVHWLAHVRRAIGRVARTLFEYQVVVRGDAPADAVGVAGSAGPPRLSRRLAGLRAALPGLAAPPDDAPRELRMAWVEGMGRLLTEANALHAELRDEIRRHLAGDGLSPGEIERRTEEAARLWRAA